ncbi:hypothetical protein FBT96_17320 [Rhodobacter capsulatus]|uniref:Uncharacterized protein n=1 Tax=Rhodobacter capsulatus TaxID=1061 RepID=A0A4U1JM30_RHOCA|nr:hypothetical protein [Rhodobacter capsulatus]TKD15380.1 hypothetical protein FBT96_17320 [Rhodobacter capsulatus]
MSDPATRLDQTRPERPERAPRTGAAPDRAEAAVAAARRVEQAETEAFIQRMRAIVESRSPGAGLGAGPGAGPGTGAVTGPGVGTGWTGHLLSGRLCDD